MRDKYYQINSNMLWDIISCILSQSNQDDKMAIWGMCIHIVSRSVESNYGEWTKFQIAGIVNLITTRLWRASVALKDDDAVCNFPDEIISKYRNKQAELVSGEKFASSEVMDRLNYLFRRAKAQLTTY